MPATDDLLSVAREVEDFVSSAGWDQAPQLFALVPTAELLAQQPELAETLASIMWPDAVHGCALAQEIVVLPPEAVDTQLAAEHPQRREARLVAAVLRDGTAACVLRLRGADGEDLVESPDLAPNLTRALLATLR